MHKDIKKIDIEGTPTYVKRDGFGRGYRIVHPVKNEDDTINWFNLCTGGSWWNSIIVAFVIFIILFGTWSYKRDTKVLKETLEYAITNPCDWCEIVSNKQPLPSDFEFNFTDAMEKIQEEVKNGTNG